MILQADARNIPLRDACVQCVVTSPPYWGLRKYAGAQDLVWNAAQGCSHDWASNGFTPEHPDRGTDGKDSNGSGLIGGPRTQSSKTARGESAPLGDTCQLCRAWRGGFGLEPTIEMYIAHTVEILREIRRVLRPDGVVFWNIGDSYAGGGRGGNPSRRSDNWQPEYPSAIISPGLKPKDLCLIPERVAIAAQDDGWWIRSMIIWAKPNPMPESVTDRPTDAYEHILMLTKSERYFWDADSVREPHQAESIARASRNWSGEHARDYPGNPQTLKMGEDQQMCHPGGRNMRNVWTFPTQPYRGAHFATFPEEIPRRCIKAATSEEGCCAACGAPRARILKVSGGTIGQSYINHSTDDVRGRRMDIGGRNLSAELRDTYKRETVGWKRTCDCPVDEVKPCIVLDPFGGSGTTARVALELDRMPVSLDLAYHDHAERRTKNVQRFLMQT